MNTVALRRRVLEAANALAKAREIGMPEISAVTQPLAELISAESGINVEIVLRIKDHKAAVPGGRSSHAISSRRPGADPATVRERE